MKSFRLESNFLEEKSAAIKLQIHNKGIFEERAHFKKIIFSRKGAFQRKSASQRKRAVQENRFAKERIPRKVQFESHIVQCSSVIIARNSDMKEPLTDFPVQLTYIFQGFGFVLQILPSRLLNGHLFCWVLYLYLSVCL